MIMPKTEPARLLSTYVGTPRSGIDKLANLQYYHGIAQSSIASRLRLFHATLRCGRNGGHFARIPSE